ncbi:MAG: MFS transporter [Caulobacterales bacterium 68-7]|nr:MFS transporter [Caulobacterales bacterium]OJU12484.1 MAG: MFS transporter [Caulobacterales bacterium 68-7]
MSKPHAPHHGHPQSFTPQERRVTMIGIVIVFMLSALDQTIVSTAMPRIVAELNGLPLYAWVTTSYLLTSTVMVPIWGKLGDLYGRKPVLLSGIGIFLLGSWLSGLAGEFGDLPLIGGGMVQLIVFRAIQGIGGGALFTTAFAIIADLYPPRERGKFAGMFGSIFGLASVIGPVVGGYFTEHGTFHLGAHVVAGWRWVFYLNLPLSALSLFMIIAKMPPMTHRRPGSVDYIGAILLVISATALLLALSFGGHTYPWASAPVIGLFALSAVTLAAFIFAERVVRDPILPLTLFGNRTFSTSNGAAFLVSVAFMGVVSFLPLYMQLGQGVSPTKSGLSILPLMGGLILSSTISGQLVSKTGRYKPFMFIGAGLLFLGILALSRVTVDTTTLDLSWRLAVMGLGLGPGMSLYAMAAQNAVPVDRIGVATSSNQFFRQIGSTVGVAVFGALLTHSLGSAAGGLDLGQLEGLALKAGAGTGVDPALRIAISHAITGLFVAALFVVAAAVAVIVFIPELPLRSRQPPGEPTVAPEPSH